jgi:uncharacterized protein
MASWEPEERVDVASTQQGWEALTFVHFAYEPEAIASLVPAPLTLDTFEGRAWVGITPFRLQASVLPMAPGPRTTHVEVNVRTYVRDADGRDGLWFLSLELDQGAVAAAIRTALALPYRWSDAWIEDEGTVVRYGVRRRPPHREGSLELAVEVGEPLEEVGPFETYLVGRWRAFTERGGTMLTVPVEHEPWRLVHAELTEWRSDRFLESLGLPTPSAEPHVLFSPGVDAKLGFPHGATDGVADGGEGA